MYEKVLRERNLMYLDSVLYFWMGACGLVFILGVVIGGYFYRKVRGQSRPWVNSFLTPRVSLLRGMTASLIGLNIVLIMVRVAYLQATIGLGNITATFQGGGGSGLRDQIIESIASGSVGWISDFTLGLSVAVIWVANQVPQDRRRGFLLAAYANLIIFVSSSLLTLSRDIMLTGILIAILLQISTLRGRGFGSRLRAFLAIFVGIALFAGLFALVGQSRSSGGEDTLLRQFLGYFPASYNRLAAILDGSLVYPNSGIGYYSTQFFWDFPGISRILYDLGRSLGIDLPLSAVNNWDAQFQAISGVSLNRSYIWTTAFGFVYSDFGWWGVLYFFGYGMLAGALYLSFRRGRLAGGLLYPYFLTTIVKWWSILYLSARTTDIMVIVLLLVVSLGWFFKGWQTVSLSK